MESTPIENRTGNNWLKKQQRIANKAKKKKERETASPVSIPKTVPQKERMKDAKNAHSTKSKTILKKTDHVRK